MKWRIPNSMFPMLTLALFSFAVPACNANPRPGSSEIGQTEFAASADDGYETGDMLDDTAGSEQDTSRFKASTKATPIHLECNPAAVEILESNNEGALFARRVLPEEIDAIVDATGTPKGGSEGESAVGSGTANATPYWCNDKPCWSCAGTCWFGGKQVYFEGRTQWNESQQACYCVGHGNYWNCCQ